MSTTPPELKHDTTTTDDLPIPALIRQLANLPPIPSPPLRRDSATGLVCSSPSFRTQLEQRQRELDDAASNELLLVANPNRHVLYPIRHKDIFAMYKKQMSTLWTAEEVDLSTDYQHGWSRLNENEQHFIKHVLAFFAASDGIVMENLATRFFDEVQLPEARQFYASQILIEAIHSETYSLLIDTYIKSPDEKLQLLQAAQQLACVQAKAEWALKWIQSNSSFVTRLFAFAIVEGVFFSGAFCAIFWLKTRPNKHLPGLFFSNEMIARDEGLHTEFACLLYREYIKHPLTFEQAEAIVRDAVAIEEKFVCDALPCSLIGMNAVLMSQYIKFVADRLMLSCGYTQRIYNVTNPFAFMETISLQGKTNFFERRVGEYQARAKAVVRSDSSGASSSSSSNSFATTTTTSENRFCLDAEF